jgi:hypothetical protein
MRAGFNAELSSLHVRVSNRGALNLYQDALGYDVERIIPAYYQDGEDAYLMRAPMGSSQQQAAATATSKVGGGTAALENDVTSSSAAIKSLRGSSNNLPPTPSPQSPATVSSLQIMTASASSSSSLSLSSDGLKQPLPVMAGGAVPVASITAEP